MSTLRSSLAGGIFGGTEGAVSSYIMQQVASATDSALDGAGPLQTEVFESVGRDIDFEQRNEENMMQQYSRFGSSSSIQHQQQSQNIVMEDIDAKRSQSTFIEIGEKNLESRKHVSQSKQAQIAQRLLRIRKEIGKLDKELKAATASPPEQSSGEVVLSTQEATPPQPAAQLEQLETLKFKLMDIYKLKGFEKLTQQLKHLQPLKKPEVSSEEATVQDLSSILQKLDASNTSQETTGISLVVDRSKKDVGLLIRLYQLQRRISLINNYIGEWKPTLKYKSMTEQIEYVSKRMELFDPQKLMLMQSKTKNLNEELLMLMSDPKEVKELGHDREEIDELYGSAIKVKSTMGNIEKLVDRLESKRRIHDLSAKVVMDIEQLELQQMQIIGSMKENKELLDYIRQGITENTTVIKKNIDFLNQRSK